MQKRITLLILLLCLAIIKTWAIDHDPDTVILYEQKQLYNVGKNIWYLEDKQSSLSMDDVMTAYISEQFKRSDQEEPFFGYSESVYWLRLSVQNNSNLDWILVVEEPWLSQIDIFCVDDRGDYSVRRAGYNYPFSRREIPHRFFIFQLDFSDSPRMTIYLRVRERNFPLFLPMHITTKTVFFTEQGLRNILIGFYSGLLFIMVVYNLFLLLSHKDLIYLFFALLIVSLGVFQLARTGLGFQFFWPSLPEFNFTIYIMLTFASQICGIQFMRVFLEVKKFLPRFDMYALAVMGLYALYMIIAVFASSPLLLIIHNTSGMLLLSSFIVPTFSSLKRRYEPVYYFFIGFSLVILSSILWGLRTLTLIAPSILTDYSLHFSTAIMVVIISYALSDRFKRLKIEKERSERSNLEKTEFFINLAHEVKTPLTLISNYLDEYITKAGLSPELKIIKQNIEKLLRDMMNFFDVLRFERGMRIYNHDSVLNLSELISKKAELFSRLAEKNKITIRIGEITDKVLVKADALAIERIINNLLENAIKYNKKGGTVSVSLTVTDAEAELNIEDTGVGIAEDQLDKIFLPYYQLSHNKENIQGIGMGLTIVSRIAKELSGTVLVESKKNVGSKFSVLLPLYRGEEKPLDILPLSASYYSPLPEYGDVAEQEIAGKKLYNILIVEDNRDLLNLMKKVISRNYNVYCAENGIQAVAKLKETTRMHLIISDIMMDSMDGYKLLEAVSGDKSYRDIPFIFLTAKSGRKETIKGLEKGAIDFISKPFHFNELLSRIETLLRNRELTKQNYERDKFASLGMLVGGISHELLNPLSGISAPLANIKKIIKDSDFKSHKKLNTCLEHMDISVERIAGIIKDLKILYSDGEYKQEQLDFNRILTSVLDLLKHKIAQGVKVNVKIEKGLKVRGDRGAVFFIFVNLINNALEAIAEDGNIDISIKKIKNETVIKVADDGCGIDDKDIKDIFNAFYSTKSVADNNGLGLYSVKKVLLKHDWDINVISEKGKGTCFIIKIKEV
ncbi:MAG: response regulator [Spirochaetales bacterium]|nr:response regulator [Spirochaetales bacterium]